MLEGRDVSRTDVLLDLGVAAGAEPAAFEAALQGPEATAAFRDDLTEARYREVRRFPTLVLHRSGPMGLVLVGCRPYEALEEAVTRIAPDLQPRRLEGAAGLAQYAADWGRVTAHELAANFGIAFGRVPGD
ncbi:Putative dithiol-disulfide isomerase involved in polyketide biosynthesis OS=Oscillatoria acuminata PCC 6304 GN=Oscil6304_3026 PE=4 SV=1 [Gemmataceae bacterium]|jgi:predicted DsbA family dithiol-disulfide isomerase|nr:Putative dithiol-disulfide isomerase involved in polyketide biosynthesis OS=Oscillatoria acuminata PCC 6304 GN=Oscil6304_3026 PE=4 SV=1 [Gemmataceae bacterium]VTU02606.1 Putative dithiol-disulfide isomerase involved in polyketide biosynthesis OS=Oscillatoria acuminata PCC 6304 GN=Oscil6304_3026 PE=4 SV=1 [Gemmataceae bacterium]